MHRRAVLVAVLMAATAVMVVEARPAAVPFKKYDVKQKVQLQQRVVDLFEHAYTSYMTHAFPMDELKPLTCKGTNQFGGYAVTLVDALDTLATLGFRNEFWEQVDYVTHHLFFNASMHVSVFETTIRVMGGLLSAHALALQMSAEARNRTVAPPTQQQQWVATAALYNGALLGKAVDIADRLMGAFDTPTGIPFNEIHLCHGVDRRKGHTTCPAAAGTLLLEFGTLAAWTKNCTYMTVAKRALDGIWKHRGRNHLVGTMIDILSGVWIHSEAHIGASIDSFYEYLVKAYILFGEDAYYDKWLVAYRAIQKYTYHNGWFLTSTVESLTGGVVGDENDFKFNSLQAFWPGLQVLSGDVTGALDAYVKMHCIVNDWGTLPEYVHLGAYTRQHPPTKIGPGYPLRPEFLESTYFLYEATGDNHFLAVAERFLNMVAATKQPCGFAAVLDVHSHTFEDKMDSYLLAETFKYLYLIFQPTDKEIFEERQHWRHLYGPKSRLPIELRYHAEHSEAVPLRLASVFNTEAHPLPVTLTTQSVIAHCAAHEDMFFLGHNDMRKLRAAFSTFDPSSYERLVTRSWHQQPLVASTPLHQRGVLPDAPASLAMCPVVDYMRDVAPFMQRLHWQVSGALPSQCYEPITAITLGHRRKTTHRVSATSLHQRNAAASEQSARHGMQALEGTESTLVEFRVPRDPTLPWSRDLKYFLTVVDVGKAHAAPVIAVQRGITSVEHAPGIIDNLYVSMHHVIVIGGPTADPQSPRFFTTGAEYNPPLVCNPAAPQPRDDGRMLWTDAPVFRVKGDGCHLDSWPDALRTPGEPSMGGSDSIRQIIHQRRSMRRSGQQQPPSASNAIVPPPLVFGVVIRRGGCTFKAKTRTAQRLGASFALITNNEEWLAQMADVALDGNDAFVPTIPSYMIMAQDMEHLTYRADNDSMDESEDVKALRSEAWVDTDGTTLDLRLRRISLMCVLSANTQLQALHVSASVVSRRVRTPFAYTTVHVHNDRPIADRQDIVVLYHNRFAPIVQRGLNEEEHNVQQALQIGVVSRPSRIGVLAGRGAVGVGQHAEPGAGHLQIKFGGPHCPWTVPHMAASTRRVGEGRFSAFVSAHAAEMLRGVDLPSGALRVLDIRWADASPSGDAYPTHAVGEGLVHTEGVGGTCFSLSSSSAHNAAFRATWVSAALGTALLACNGSDSVRREDLLGRRVVMAFGQPPLMEANDAQCHVERLGWVAYVSLLALKASPALQPDTPTWENWAGQFTRNALEFTDLLRADAEINSPLAFFHTRVNATHFVEVVVSPTEGAGADMGAASPVLDDGDWYLRPFSLSRVLSEKRQLFVDERRSERWTMRL